MNERRFRKYFFACLNKYRISGMFILSEKSFKILGELLYEILNEIYKDKDYESAKACMILSQTFYRVSTELSTPRLFLQIAIESHIIWKDMEIWEWILKSN